MAVDEECSFLLAVQDDPAFLSGPNRVSAAITLKVVLGFDDLTVFTLFAAHRLPP